MKQSKIKYLTPKDIKHLPTKGDVVNITTKVVGEATDAILHGMDEIAKKMATKEELKMTKEVLENKIEEVKTEISYVRDDIKGLEGELALTPTRKEFEKLKGQVAQIATN